MTPIDVVLVIAWGLVVVEAIRLLWTIWGYNIKWKWTLLRRWYWGLVFDLTWKEAKADKGWCCCGDRVEDHGYTSDHSPVDRYHYHKDRYIFNRMRR